MQNAMAKPDNAGAAATDYMQLFRPSSLFAYMWGADGESSRQDKIAAGGTTPYLTTKLVTGRFFMERMLPETSVHLGAHPDRKARPPWNWRRKRSDRRNSSTAFDQIRDSFPIAHIL